VAILSVLAEPGAAQSTFGAPVNQRLSQSPDTSTEYRYGRFRFNTGFEWNQGDYGSAGGDTTRWYVPFTLRYDYQQFRFSLTVPYLNISSPGNVIGGGGGGVVIDNSNRVRLNSGSGELEVDDRGRGRGRGRGGDDGGRGRGRGGGDDDVVDVGGATVVDPCRQNRGVNPNCPEDSDLAGTFTPQGTVPQSAAAAAVAANSTPTRNTAGGIGDVIAGLTYSYDPGQSAFLPFVDLTFKVKLPTADEEKGLGTGAFDYILQADIDKTFGNFTPLARIGYRWNGDLEVGRTKLVLNDVIFASLGGQYQVTPAISLGATVDYYEAASEFADDALEVYSYVRWRATRHFAASLYGIAGLTDGSPDQGVGVQLSFNQ
jgi:hypothetical protein